MGNQRLIRLEDYTDMKDFIDAAYEVTSTGKNALVSMHGYKALVYARSNKLSIRMSIIKKLRDIQNLEVNLQALREYSSLQEEEVEEIRATKKPDEIADMCLEYGICGVHAAKSKTM